VPAGYAVDLQSLQNHLCGAHLVQHFQLRIVPACLIKVFWDAMKVLPGDDSDSQTRAGC
jgi:hypothetical protein